MNFSTVSLTLSMLAPFATGLPATAQNASLLVTRDDFPNPYPDCHKQHHGAWDHCLAGMRTHPARKTATVSIFDWDCTLLTMKDGEGGETLSLDTTRLPSTVKATLYPRDGVDHVKIEYDGVTWGDDSTQNDVGAWWWEPIGDSEHSNWGMVRFACPNLIQEKA